MNQPEEFLRRPYSGPGRLELEFREFHAENPEILSIVIREALRAKFAGIEIGGIALVWERIRWLMTVETKSEDGFKLNNNHRAFYARLAMHVEPRLSDFFEVRVQRGADFDPATVPVQEV